MKQKDILILLIPSFIVIVAWIAFSIYHSSVSSTVTPIQNLQIAPITPSFDSAEITQLKQRTSVNPIYEVQNVPSPSPTPFLPASTVSSQSGIPLGAPANNPQGSSGGTLAP